MFLSFIPQQTELNFSCFTFSFCQDRLTKLSRKGLSLSLCLLPPTLPLFSAENSDKAQPLSVPAAPNVNVAVEHSNPLLQICPTITPDKNADIGRVRLRSVMQWWSNVFTVLAFYNICTWWVWFGLHPQPLPQPPVSLRSPSLYKLPALIFNVGTGSISWPADLSKKRPIFKDSLNHILFC